MSAAEVLEPGWRARVAADHADPGGWVDEWLGLPYAERGRGVDGYDCWGLCRAAAEKRFGVLLPSFAHCYDGSQDLERIHAKIAQAVTGWIETQDPAPGDFVWMWWEIPERPSHVALYVGGGQALTAADGGGSYLIDLRRRHWARRVVGFYRPRVGWQPDEARPLPVPVEMVRVTAPKTGLSHAKVERVYPAGGTLVDYLNQIAPLCDGSGKATVYVGGVPVAREHWDRVKPKAGVDVSVEYVAEVELGVALGAIATFLGTPVFTLVGGATITYATLLKGALSIGIAVASSVLGQTSTPDLPELGKQASPTLRGVGNDVRPWEPIPVVFGLHRVFPSFAAPPFTFVKGGKQFVRAVVALQGRYKITELKIGDVAIEDVDGARWQIREGGFVSPFEAEIKTSRANGSAIHRFYRLDPDGAGLILDAVDPAKTAQIQGTGWSSVASLIPDEVNPATRTTAASVIAAGAGFTMPGPTWSIVLVGRFPAGSIGSQGSESTVLMAGDIANKNGVEIWIKAGQFHVADEDEISKDIRFAVEADTTYHLVLSFDGDNYSLYVNGQLGREKKAKITLAEDFFSIGGRFKRTGSVISRTTPGDYDDIQFWQTHLTQSEVRGLYEVQMLGAETRGGFLSIFSDTQAEAQPEQVFLTPNFDEAATSDRRVIDVPGKAARGSITIQHTGLFRQTDESDGRSTPYEYQIRLRMRDLATGPDAAWQDVTALDSFAGAEAPVTIQPEFVPLPILQDAGGYLEAKGRRSDPFLRQYDWDFPHESEEWQIDVQRHDPLDPKQRPGGAGTASVNADFVVVSVRGILRAAPFKLEGLATVAIEAPIDAIGGNLGQINLLAESVVPIYDANGNFTGEAPSRNAADLVLWAWLTHEAETVVTINPREMPIGDIEFAEFDELRQWVEEQGFYHSSVWDSFKNMFMLGIELMRSARAQPDYTEDGKWGVVIDRPQLNSKLLISSLNSSDFRIVRTFVDQYHAMRVAFLNAAKGYRKDQLIVYADGHDATTAKKFREIDLTQDGIVDADHAYRHARVEMAASRLVREVFTCTMGIEQYRARRGKRAKYAHPVAVVGKMAGRVTKVFDDGFGSQTGVLLSAEMDYEDGAEYGVELVLFSGLRFHRDVVNRAAGTGGAVRSNRFDFVDVVSIGLALIEVDCHVVAGLRSLEAGDALILAKVPQPNRTAQIVMVPYQPGVYTAADEPIPEFDSQITLPGPIAIAGPALPVIARVTSDETAMAPNASGVLLPRIFVDFTIGSGRSRINIVRTEAQYRGSPGSPSGGTEWKDLQAGSSTSGRFVIDSVEEGETYDIRLHTVGANGNPSAWVYALDHVVLGQSAPPASPTKLRLERLDQLRWDMVLPPDHAGFKVRVHSGARNDFDAAAPLHDGIHTAQVFDLPTIGGGQRTFLVVAVDRSGTESLLPAFLTTTLADPEAANAVIEIDERAAGFPGTKTGGTVVGGDLVANGEASDFWAKPDTSPFWGADSGLYWTGSYAAMSYVWTVAHSATNPAGELFLNLTAQGSVLIEYDRGVTGTYLPYPGRVAISSGESIRLRISFGHGATQGKITRLVSVIDVPDVVHKVTNVTVPATGTYRISLGGKTFRAVTRVNWTAYQDVDGLPRVIEVLDKGTGGPPLTGGPSIQSRQANAAGTRIAGQFDLEVVGY